MRRVAARAAAWIEIPILFCSAVTCRVAARAAAWIEISLFSLASMVLIVAARAAAWIEIGGVCAQFLRRDGSPLAQRRGLKSRSPVSEIVHVGVAARAAAWIEMTVESISASAR